MPRTRSKTSKKSKKDPVKKEPVKKEPVKKEPVKKEPVKKEHVEREHVEKDDPVPRVRRGATKEEPTVAPAPDALELDIPPHADPKLDTEDAAEVTKPRKYEYMEWNTDKVVQWLETTNPVLKRKYETAFRDEGLDGTMLPELDDETLKKDLHEEAHCIGNAFCERDAGSKEVEICFSFDTTGSMYACLGQVRRNIKQLVSRILKDVPHTKIALIAHGDYGDEDHPESYLLKKCNFSCDREILCDWITNVESTNGYDMEEAYEYVLQETQKLSWSPSCRKRSLVLIGDANPHTTYNNKYNIDWRIEAAKLHRMGVRVHTVQALGYDSSRPFYQELAQTTGGMYLELSQFSSARDLMLGISFAQIHNLDNRAGLLTKLEEEVSRGGRMTRCMQRAFDRLQDRKPSASAFVPDGLEVVNPGRFQVLDVDENVSIKVFAESQGLIFKAGRGFYQFTKSEIISPKKEVVLQYRETGDFFSGDKARDMLGISEASAMTRL
eukprot:IDg9969t1